MTTPVTADALQSGVSIQPTSVCKQLDVSLSFCSQCSKGCTAYSLAAPRLIASARMLNAPSLSHAQLIAASKASDADIVKALALGQDSEFDSDPNRKNPLGDGVSVGDDEEALKPKMHALLDQFASKDPDGKAKRLVEAFLGKNGKMEIFTDPALDKAVKAHENFVGFSDRTVASGSSPIKVRIHQALQNAAWDINQVALISDLVPLAFNLGDKILGTLDFATGLGLMIDSVTQVFVYAQRYEYQSCNKQYLLDLKFVLYDVFGLDDADLTKKVAVPYTDGKVTLPSGGTAYTVAGRTARQGLTAWWQLQHQKGYAPLLTKVVVEKSYLVNTEEACQ